MVKQLSRKTILLCRSISSFCLVFQRILQNDGLFRSFYIQQEKAQNEDKLKQFTYLPAIKNMVLQHDCYACCVSSHGTKNHSFRLSTYWSDNVSFAWNNFTARVSALTFLVLHPNPLAFSSGERLHCVTRRGRNIFNALTEQLAAQPGHRAKQAK